MLKKYFVHKTLMFLYNILNDIQIYLNMSFMNFFYWFSKKSWKMGRGTGLQASGRTQALLLWTHSTNRLNKTSFIFICNLWTSLWYNTQYLLLPVPFMNSSILSESVYSKKLEKKDMTVCVFGQKISDSTLGSCLSGFWKGDLVEMVSPKRSNCASIHPRAYYTKVIWCLVEVWWWEKVSTKPATGQLRSTHPWA